MRTLVVALFFTGVVLVVVNELVKARACGVQIEYRYLPRDLDTYLREAPKTGAVFRSMFTEPSLRY